MDPAACGAALHRGAAGGGAALRVGAAEAGGERRGRAVGSGLGPGQGGGGEVNVLPHRKSVKVWKSRVPAGWIQALLRGAQQ